jgi:hypothetical protein
MKNHPQSKRTENGYKKVKNGIFSHRLEHELRRFFTV